MTPAWELPDDWAAALAESSDPLALADVAVTVLYEHHLCLYGRGRALELQPQVCAAVERACGTTGSVQEILDAAGWTDRRLAGLPPLDPFADFDGVLILPPKRGKHG